MTTFKRSKEIIDYLTQFIGVKYRWWYIGSNPLNPMALSAGSYCDSDDAKDIQKIKEEGINCIGLPNLVRHYLKLPIPGTTSEFKTKYCGGTGAWFEYLLQKCKLQPIKENLSYPRGTLLLRDYNSETDQGHVAIITKNSKSFSDSIIIHSFSANKFNPDKPDETVSPGVVIENVMNSHKWFKGGSYKYFCLPKDWMTNTNKSNKKFKSNSSKKKITKKRITKKRITKKKKSKN